MLFLIRKFIIFSESVPNLTLEFSSADIVTKDEHPSESASIISSVSKPNLLTSEEPKASNSNNKEIPTVIIRRKDKKLSNDRRLSVTSNESDRKSTVSDDSVEVLGSTSTTTPDSETSPSKARNSNSYESSIEILSSSSVEILNSAEDPNRYFEAYFIK